MIRGHNSDLAHSHSGDHAVEFFSKAGSLMTKGKGKGRKGKKNAKGAAYYGDSNEATALALFRPVWMMPGLDNKVMAMKLLFWLRDPRGGAGNKSGFQECLRWLASQPATPATLDDSGAAWLAVNLQGIPEYGYWKDMAQLFGSPLQTLAANLWAGAIMRGDHLACKWAKCDMRPLQKALKTNEAGLRKLLRGPREGIVERPMCAGNWASIDYSKLPSKAMNMYVNAFKKRDSARFAAYKQALVKGDKSVKINASVLFPYDCLKQAREKDTVIANAQFDAMPNYMAESGRRMLALIDTSGSMSSQAADGISNMDVAVSLGLYVSDRLGKDNPFYRRYMEFESQPYWVDWRNKTFAQAVNFRHGYVGSTNIASALDSILQSAIAVKLAPDKMITHLLIISDMQFDGGACVGQSAVEGCMQKWERAGYIRPTIIFWQVTGYAGQQATADTPNTALVSGFSPAILTSILSGKVITPREVMLRALDKYQVETPVLG